MAIDLEAVLIDLADSLRFDGEEQLAERVVASLAAPPPAVPLRRRPALRRALVLVAAAAVVIAAVLVASPRARRAVADLLGIGGIEIRSSSSTLPSTPATAAPTAPGTPTTSRPTFPTTFAPGLLGLGPPIAVEDGAQRLGIVAPVPIALGPPDAAYFGERPPGGQLSLVWAPSANLPATRIPGIGALLSVFRGTLVPTGFEKALDADTTYERVAVRGGNGVWLAGAPHRFVYRDPNGDVEEASLRLAGNTLIWTDGGLTYRLESALDRDTAIAIAESLPAG